MKKESQREEFIEYEILSFFKEKDILCWHNDIK
jgi:hypothetical protein